MERAIQTIKRILTKSHNLVDITKVLTAFLDTPIDTDLPSPAELFFNRRINTRLAQGLNHSILTDQEKTKLYNKRSAHIKPAKSTQNFYAQQPIWFTDDKTTEWKPGFIESIDEAPDSYWIISEDNLHWIRRNKHDIKPRIPLPKEANQQSTGTPLPTSVHLQPTLSNPMQPRVMDRIPDDNTRSPTSLTYQHAMCLRQAKLHHPRTLSLFATCVRESLLFLR